ncbi:MAG TPA: hypothetical protein VGI57_16440 [Usitatibacter sp.]
MFETKVRTNQKSFTTYKLGEQTMSGFFVKCILVAAFALLSLGSAHAQVFLNQGDTLRVGQILVASKYGYFTIMQEDGNLCTYRGTGPGRQRGVVGCVLGRSPGKGMYYATMQDNGRLCIYPGAPEARKQLGAFAPGASWCSPEPAPAVRAKGSFYVFMRDDGDLAVMSGTNRPLSLTDVNVPRDTQVWMRSNLAFGSKKYVANTYRDRYVWFTSYTWAKVIISTACVEPGQAGYIEGHTPGNITIIRAEIMDGVECKGTKWCDTTAQDLSYSIATPQGTDPRKCFISGRPEGEKRE